MQENFLLRGRVESVLLRKMTLFAHGSYLPKSVALGSRTEAHGFQLRLPDKKQISETLYREGNPVPITVALNMGR